MCGACAGDGKRNHNQLFSCEPCTAPTEAEYIAELEAKVAELTKENTAAEDQLAAFSQKIDTLSAPLGTCGCSYDHPAHVRMVHSPQLVAANTHIAELEKDKSRLDWLDSQNYNGCTEIYLGGPWRYYSETNQTIGRWKIEGRPSERFVTVREAIDAAMNQTAQEQKK